MHWPALYLVAHEEKLLLLQSEMMHALHTFLLKDSSQRLNAQQFLLHALVLKERAFSAERGPASMSFVSDWSEDDGRIQVTYSFVQVLLLPNSPTDLPHASHMGRMCRTQHGAHLLTILTVRHEPPITSL